MTDSQPKFKFKKRSKASLKKKQLRRTAEDKENDATATTTTTTITVDGAVKTEDSANGSTGGTVKVEDDNVISSDHPIPRHDVEEEEEPSALNTILAVERRRKLLGVAGRSRGVDTANLGKNTKRANNRVKTINASKEESSENNHVDPLAQNKDLEERIKVNFAGGKLAGSNDMGGDDEGGILAKKHRRAMEDFILQNLDSAAEGGGGGASNSNNNGSSQGDESKNKASEAEKEMYAELLTSNEVAEGDNSGNDATANASGEGDVGAGGAMMGGTGIAEVALPIDERIKALKETERAAMEYERARKAARSGMMGDEDRGGMMMPPLGVAEEGNAASENSPSLADMVPMNFASGPGKRKRQEDVSLPPAQTSIESRSTPMVGNDYSNNDVQSSSSALPPSSSLPSYSASSAGPSVQKSDVSALGASYSHNFQLHTKEWVSRRRDERQVEIDAIQVQQEIEEGPTPESRARMGFEMSRKMARGEVVAPPAAGAGSTTGGKQSSSGGGKGPNGESLRNDWDRKQGGNPHGNDDRVWRTFMSKQHNRR